MLEQAGLNVGYLAYHTTKKPFDDVRVRKAIHMAINKQAIIDAVYLCSGVAAKNPIPTTQWSYNHAIKCGRVRLSSPESSFFHVLRPEQPWPYYEALARMQVKFY